MTVISFFDFPPPRAPANARPAQASVAMDTDDLPSGTPGVSYCPCQWLGGDLAIGHPLAKPVCGPQGVHDASHGSGRRVLQPSPQKNGHNLFQYVASHIEARHTDFEMPQINGIVKYVCKGCARRIGRLIDMDAGGTASETPMR